MTPRAPVDAEYLAALPDTEDLLDADNDVLPGIAPGDVPTGGRDTD